MNASLRFPNAVLRGFSQVMLQTNPFTGVLFFMGIMATSLDMALLALLGNLIGLLSAFAIKRNIEDLVDGIYGFNGVLVGIAVYFLFAAQWSQSIWLFIALVVFASALSTLLMAAFEHWNRLPAYTMPFVLSTWVVVVLVNTLGWASGETTMTLPWLPAFIPEAAFLASFGVDISQASGPFLQYLATILRGVGQVMFQDSLVTGLIFLVALSRSSNRVTAYAVLGAGLGGAMALSGGIAPLEVHHGLYGFNAVLTAIALASVMKEKIHFTIMGVGLSVLITWLFVALQWPSLTAPFVLATWAMILLHQLWQQRQQKRAVS